MKMPLNKSKLRPILAAAFLHHTEQDGGVISGSRALLDTSIVAIIAWLRHHKETFRKVGMTDEAEALQELIRNLPLNDVAR